MVTQTIQFDRRAEVEINRFDRTTQEKITYLIEALRITGYLTLPYAKKITEELFEIRIKHKNQYRAIYAYLPEKTIIILSAFIKKTQKTPLKELNKALQRLNEHKKFIQRRIS